MFARLIFRNLLRNQRGLSLVEVLLSVSIMSFISLSIMGYFIQSVESSSEDSRRIVAIKLADQKVEQLRSFLQDKKNQLNDLTVFAEDNNNESLIVSGKVLASNNNLPDVQVLNSINLSSYLQSTKNINGTDYHYLVELIPGAQPAFSDTYTRFTIGNSQESPNQALLKFRVTVFWGMSPEVLSPSPKQSTVLDSYVVFRR